MQAKTLRLILGDQLNASHSWYQSKSDDVLYVIAEMHQEASYVKHHIQKICAFFAAMQAFASALQSAGHQVLHIKLAAYCTILTLLPKHPTHSLFCDRDP